MGASELKAGQIWEYKTRKNEENSRIVILKIDTENKSTDRILHLRILGLKMKSNLSGQPRVIEGLGHVPTSEKKIRADLIKLVGTTPITEDMLEGIKQWKAAKGGVWSQGLAQTISTIEESMNKK